MNLLNGLVGGAIAFAFSATAASAVTAITINAGSLQQQDNSPCIISQTPSCQNPDGFFFTAVPQGGNVDDFDALSPVYTVQQIRDVVGDTFSVGLDVGEAAGQGPQTLNLFQMLISSVVVSQFLLGDDDDPANVPPTNPGNGFSDHILSGLVSLEALAGDVQVQFRAAMSNLSGGPDSFFLIADEPTTVIPLPTAGLLLLTGLAGLGFMSRRRRAA